MAAATCWSLVLAFLCACLSDARAEEHCNITNVMKTCEWGCCGDYPDIECCHWAIKFIHLLVWSGIVGLALVVTLIVGVVLLCKKKTVMEGTVLRPPGYAGDQTNAFSVQTAGLWMADPGVSQPVAATLLPSYPGPAYTSTTAPGIMDSERGTKS